MPEVVPTGDVEEAVDAPAQLVERRGVVEVSADQQGAVGFEGARAAGIADQGN